jgi:hypothetical protein
VSGAGDAQQLTKVYPLKHAVAERVVVLLRSFFIVVNAQEAYVRFHCDETTNSLIVGASRQHQRQIVRVLALVDTHDKAPAQAGERDEQDRLVKGYRIKHTDGEAAVAALRSLFLVVNHRVAYARFAYDARTHLLITIASEKHQKQIAKVLELLEKPASPAKERAVNLDAEQQVHLIPIKHIDGEQLISKLRAKSSVVNHEQAQARFGFDPRTRSLIVIAARKLQTTIRDMIEDLDLEMNVRAKANERRGKTGAPSNVEDFGIQAFTVRAVLSEINTKNRTISLTIPKKALKGKIVRKDNGIDIDVEGDGIASNEPTRLVNVPLAKDATFLRGKKQLKISDLRAGMRVIVQLTSSERSPIVARRVEVRADRDDGFQDIEVDGEKRGKP